MQKNIAIVNIYNFIRKTVYPSGKAVREEFDAVLYEIEEIKKYGLSATYALKYDALMDSNYIKILKDNVDDNDEIGCWFEIDKSLAEKAGVQWKGNTPVDDYVNRGYSLAYTPEERVKMIDVYMKDFKSIFGYYPKSVGSWVIDIISLKHFKEVYGVLGAAICRDQIGTDGFTLSGGYYNQAYYPSIFNEYIPAQSKENQLDLPIFRLLGPDPIYAFEDGLRESISAVYTLEPAATIAQDENWIRWFFERMIEEENLGFSYAQAGQENTFLWNTMCKGYRLQMKHIARLAEENKLRVETLSESAAWYREKYFLTAVSTISATKDWNTDNSLKTFWYNSRFFRTSFLFEDSKLRIRDLFVFDESYKSRYYENILIEEESIFDALPVLDAHSWSSKENRVYIKFVKMQSNGDNKELVGKEIKFNKESEKSYKVSWILNCGRVLTIICNEDNIKFNLDRNFDKERIALVLNKLPVLKEVKNTKLVCEHNGFSYNISSVNSKFKKMGNELIAIIADENSIILRLSDKDELVNIEAISSLYEGKKAMIDNYIPKYKRNKIEKSFINRAIKPKIIPEIILAGANENGTFKINNENLVGEIRYTLDGKNPTIKSTLYKNPIVLNKEAVIKARIYVKGMKESEIAEGRFYQSIAIKEIIGITKPVDIKKYNHSGVYGLIDGKRGTNDYRNGSWLGYHNDLDIIVDLGSIREISKIAIGFLQDTRAWIYYPKYVSFQVSIDNKEFVDIGYINCDEKLERREIAIENIEVIKKVKCKYIRIFAKNKKECPDWSIMPGEGPVFLFTDQVIIL